MLLLLFEGDGGVCLEWGGVGWGCTAQNMDCSHLYKAIGVYYDGMGWMEREKDYQCTVFVCWFVVAGGGGLNETLFKCKRKYNARFMSTPSSRVPRGALIYMHAAKENKERKTHVNGGRTNRNRF